MILARRQFLTGLGALIAAPAIVRATSLMPVRSLSGITPSNLRAYDNLYAELCDITRRAFVPRLYVDLYSASPTLALIDKLERER